MLDVLRRCCGEEGSTGLLLLEAVTGGGKTHSVLDYIYEASMDPANAGRKYFFVTTLLKNLPERELRARFERDGRLEEFERKFLRLTSNVDAVLGNLTDELAEKIPADVRGLDEYRSLKRDVETCRLLGQGGRERAAYAAFLREKIRKDTEPAFRRKLSSMLRKELPGPGGAAAVMDPSNRRWHWVGELYPAAYTSRKQIIFTSFDKLIVPNTPVVAPSYHFYKSDVMENSVVFIDEFDATKETALRRIVAEGLERDFDLVASFLQVHSAFQTHVFPKQLTLPAAGRAWGGRAGAPLEKAMEKAREVCEETCAANSAMLSYRTESEERDRIPFLFRDHRSIKVFRAGGRERAYAVPNVALGLTEIKFLREQPEGGRDIADALSDMHGALSYFRNLVRMLAWNYKRRKDETSRSPSSRRDEVEEFTFEQAVRTVLAEFNLNGEYAKSVCGEILHSTHGTGRPTASSRFDLSFYERGFRYHVLENSGDHDLRTKIGVRSFPLTPEKLMLLLCEKALVVGLSATATLPTVLGNYDVDYLRGCLGSRYLEPTEEDRARIRGRYEEATGGYRDVEIVVDLLDSEASGDELDRRWLEVFDDPELAESARSAIAASCRDDGRYAEKRYLRFALAFRAFCRNADIQSMLALSSAFPGNGGSKFRLDVLEDIFSSILLENPREFEMGGRGRNLHVLRSAGFEEDKGRILSDLAAGRPAFVISTYQTVGAGQNLQYDVPPDLLPELVRVNDFDHRLQKDFDAIYLDRPTYLTVNLLDDAFDEKGLVEAIFEAEYLQEAGEISQDDAGKRIRAAFSRRYGGAGGPVPRAPRTSSVGYLCTRIVMQAVGRICRTNLKRRRVLVLADAGLKGMLCTRGLGGKALNPEFRALLDRLAEASEPSWEQASAEERAHLVCSRTKLEIDRYLKSPWIEARMEGWRALREALLRMPTRDEAASEAPDAARYFYLELPDEAREYTYDEEDDFSRCRVSFDASSPLGRSVSAQAAKLTDLMTIPDVRELFIRRGYATDFGKARRIMSPAAFNNIYRGALGEVVGRHVFESALGIELEEISEPDVFELADYAVPGSPVLVDFKNWHARQDFDSGEMRDRIRAKAAAANCKCYLVVNILDERGCGWAESVSRRGGVTIAEIPSLYVPGDGGYVYNVRALEKIKELIHAF